MPYAGPIEPSFMRDSNLRGTGHAVDFPKEWLPQKPPPTPPPAVPPTEAEDSDPYAAAKITGKSTMNTAKRKNYEKMLAAIVMEEQAIERERQRYLRQDEDALERAKEAEKQRRAAILAEREARRPVERVARFRNDGQGLAVGGDGGIFASGVHVAERARQGVCARDMWARRGRSRARCRTRAMRALFGCFCCTAFALYKML